MDTEARQLGLQYMKAAEQADTVASKLLEEARDASMAFGVRQDSAMAGRRAVLAQQAYNQRLSAVQSRQMAAFALLAADAGDKAVSAKVIAARVKDSERQRVLVTESEHATKRRNLMLQAMEATKGALKNVPPLPAQYMGRPVSGQQVTTNGTGTWRSPEYVERANFFFPSDVRAAAGSFAGVGMQNHDEWFNGLMASLNDCTCKAEEQAKSALKGLMDSDPALLGADQQADGLISRMKAEVKAHFEDSSAHIKKYPKAHIAVGLAAIGLIYLAVRSR